MRLPFLFPRLIYLGICSDRPRKVPPLVNKSLFEWLFIDCYRSVSELCWPETKYQVHEINNRFDPADVIPEIGSVRSDGVSPQGNLCVMLPPERHRRSIFHKRAERETGMSRRKWSRELPGNGERRLLVIYGPLYHYKCKKVL